MSWIIKITQVRVAIRVRVVLHDMVGLLGLAHSTDFASCRIVSVLLQSIAVVDISATAMAAFMIVALHRILHNPFPRSWFMGSRPSRKACFNVLAFNARKLPRTASALDERHESEEYTFTCGFTIGVMLNSASQSTQLPSPGMMVETAPELRLICIKCLDFEEQIEMIGGKRMRDEDFRWHSAEFILARGV